MNSWVNNIGKCLTNAILAFAIVCVVAGLINTCISKIDKKSSTTSPVEEIRIDSITKTNDKLIIKVEQLDSIKNVKIIEVKNLDNDSTLKLFYKLIRQ